MDADFSWTSYAGNRGAGLQKYGEVGVFRLPYGTTISYGDITDGTSRTAMISEWILGSGPSDDRDRKRAIFHTRTRLDRPDQLEDFANLCRDTDAATAKVSSHRKGLNWMHGEFGKTLYNHVVVPNGQTCLNGSGYQVGGWTASSRHRGGIHVLLADGHARFVGDSIARNVWEAIGSSNLGEIIDPSSY